MILGGGFRQNNESSKPWLPRESYMLKIVSSNAEGAICVNNPDADGDLLIVSARMRAALPSADQGVGKPIGL